jgi:hypothetical protein
MRRSAPKDSPRLAGSLQMMAAIHRERGENAEAERLLRQAVAIRRDRLGADHPQTAWTEVQLADLLLDRGGQDEAVVLAGAGLAALERRLPSEHHKVATARATLARANR